VSKLADAILDQFKTDLKGGWDKFTDVERLTLESVTADAADLSVRALAGEDVRNELAQIRAQVKSIRSVGSARVYSTLTLSTRRVLRTLVAALFAAA